MSYSVYQHISETLKNIISASAAEVEWYRSLSHQSDDISCYYKPFEQSTLSSSAHNHVQYSGIVGPVPALWFGVKFFAKSTAME
jgi:hypothetical protein